MRCSSTALANGLTIRAILGMRGNDATHVPQNGTGEADGTSLPRSQWIVMLPPVSCPDFEYDPNEIEKLSFLPDEPLSVTDTFYGTLWLEPSECVHVPVPPQLAELPLTVGGVAVAALNFPTSPPLSM